MSLIKAVQPPGWWILSVSLCFGILSFLGWEQSIAIALAGFGLFISAVPFQVFRSAVVAEVLPPPRAIVAGQNLHLIVRTRTNKSFFRFPEAVEVDVGPETYTARHTAANRAEIHVRGLTRGHYGVGPARSVRSDPFGIFRREIVSRDSYNLLVIPRTVPVELQSHSAAKSIAGGAGGSHTDSDLDYHSLRDYQPGDSLSRVHWYASARLGKPVVKRFEMNTAPKLTVVFDDFEDSYDSQEAFEIGVSCTASVLKALSERSVTGYLVFARSNLDPLDAGTGLGYERWAGLLAALKPVPGEAAERAPNIFRLGAIRAGERLVYVTGGKNNGFPGGIPPLDLAGFKHLIEVSPTSACSDVTSFDIRRSVITSLQELQGMFVGEV